jgi:hypothetical protein
VRRLALVGLAACWTTPVVAPQAPVANTIKRCAIVETRVTTNGLVRLSIGGSAFAQLSSPFERLAVTFKGAGAHARVETERFVLEGELDRDELAIRPRELALRDGWIEVRKAAARTAGEGALRVEAALPDGLSPKSVMFTLPCSELTFEAVPQVPEEHVDVQLHVLAIGAELRTKPDGPVVMRVGKRIDEDGIELTVDASVIEKRGAMTHVRVDGDNPVFGWVANRALTADPPGTLGGFGFGRTGFSQATSQCPREMPIYVRGIVVGKVKKGAPFFTIGGAGIEIGIDLGLRSPDSVPYLKASDFVDCE